MGTSPDYAAPEVVLGGRCKFSGTTGSHHICSKAQDMGTLGCLAYWAFVGDYPFESGSPKVAVCLQQVHEQHETWVRAAPDWYTCSFTDSFNSLPSHALTACYTV